MILGIDYLERAEKKGLIAVIGRKELSAFSINISLGNLYVNKEHKIVDMREPELSQEEFIATQLKEIHIPDSGINITPQKLYLWQPKEEIFLSEGFYGDITSRSGWARMGSCVRQTDDYLHNPYRSMRWRPLCILQTFGTHINLHQGDSLAQLFIMQGSNAMSRSLEDSFMEQGEFIIQRDGKNLTPEEARKRGKIELTMHPEVRIYQNTILVPGKQKEEDFETITLTAPYFLEQGSFFLSSSYEHVEIPVKYVGVVSERSYEHQLSTVVVDDFRHIGPHPFSAHPNAPLIGPKNVFKGRITFENYMYHSGYIFPNMFQSNLELMPLKTRITAEMPSRYMNQTSATASRL